MEVFHQQYNRSQQLFPAKNYQQHTLEPNLCKSQTKEQYLCAKYVMPPALFCYINRQSTRTAKASRIS